MPRNASGTFTLDSRYLVDEGDTILPSQHNPVLEDIQTDLNAARPIVAGGTGASSVVSARTNLSVYSKADVDDGFTAKVATKTALKALDTASVKACVLTEATRQKLFMWTTGDFTDETTADPTELSYIPADGVAVSLGCWVAVTGAGASITPIIQGGTGESTASDALTALGGMASATYDPNAVGADAFDMANMVEATDAKIMTAAERTKLSGIETAADVTDATNVASAAASITDASSFGFVLDEDDMASDSDKKVPTQQSVKAYVDSRRLFSRSSAALYDLTALSSVVVDRWSDTSPASPATYVKVGSEPAHDGKFQDSAGNWFEIDPGARFTTIEAWGATATGYDSVPTDDADAFNRAFKWQSLQKVGAGILLKPGACYAVTNINPVSKATLDGNNPDIIACFGGKARLKCISGGDSDYMLAPDRYRSDNSNKAFGNSPVHFFSILFDGNDVCDNNVIVRGFFWKFYHCDFINEVKNQCLFTRVSAAGDVASTYLSECGWYHCNFFVKAGAGLKSVGTAADEHDGPTDADVIDCTFGGPGTGQYGMDICNNAGWTITDNRTFSASVAGAYFRKMSRGANIARNNFDGTVIVIGKVGYYNPASISGNTFYVHLRVDFTDDTSSEDIVIANNHFSEDSGGTKAQIFHNNDRSTKTIWSFGNIFESTNPHTVSGTNNKYIIRDGYNGGFAVGWRFKVGSVETYCQFDTNGLSVNGVTAIDMNGRLHVPAYTLAALGDKTNTVNTLRKVAGVLVLASDTGELFVARGATATDNWKGQSGTTITPA